MAERVEQSSRPGHRSLLTESAHRLYKGRPHGGNQCGEGRRQPARFRQRRRAWPDRRRYAIEHSGEARAKVTASTSPHAQAIPATRSPCARNCRDDVASQCTERQTQGRLAPPAVDGVAHGAVETHARNRQRRRGKQCQQPGSKAVLRECVADAGLEWSDVVNGTKRLQLFERPTYGLSDRRRFALRATRK